jgi:DNA invertase Pin-like site-specific DNA recombinase
VMASLAKIETQKIGERTKAGMARAKANGARIGRPRVPQKVRDEIAVLAADGASAYRIGKQLGIDHKTVGKYPLAR